jgi:putative hydrolase of the HAD superfamily
MIKIILFDLDDTLIDHKGAEQKALLLIYNRYFRAITSAEKFKDAWLKITKKNWELFEKHQLTFKQQQQQRVIDVWLAFGKEVSAARAGEIFNQYLSEYEKAWKPFKGIINLLKLIRVPLGIVSNGNLKQQLKKLKKAKLLEFFNKKYIFTSEDVGFSKPDSRLFSFARKKLRLKSAEILYVGDKFHHDIEPAIKAGWHTIWIDHHNPGGSHQGRERLSGTAELKSAIREYGNNLLNGSAHPDSCKANRKNIGGASAKKQ